MTSRSICWIAAITGLACVILQASNPPPNVVLIMADDLGYHDLGCYGHSIIQTPNLDQLAKEGVRLTSFYSGATVCTPSRMALLTGAYPVRLGWSKGVVGYMIPKHRGLSPKALTMAEVFKNSGYATGLFGKWHLGDEPPFRPHRQGFDTAYYLNKSNNQTTKIWRNDLVVEDPFENRFLTEKFTHHAKDFIRKNRHQPFLLYLPYTAPHFPVESHPEFKGKSAFGVYGDVVEELDFRIGEIRKTLEENQLIEKTIIVFLSDNGPQPGEKAQANPYRGMKWDALEGGTRVPCILSWPGVVPPSSVSDDMIAAIDLLPTLAHACGINLSSMTKGIPKIDGINVWDTFIQKTNSSHPRNELLYWHGSKGFQAIRIGQWKLFLNAQDALPDHSGHEAALFDLSKDPREQTNLSEQYPEKVKKMRSVAEKYIQDLSENITPLASYAPGQKSVSE